MAKVLWQTYGVALLAMLSGALLFWLALHSDGCDWFISQTHADAIFTGLREFRQYPFFSFVFNGGSYFLQDPQSNLFSPIVPLTLLVGPSLALRLLNGLWGAVGVLLFVGWMRRRVRTEAALIGGVASVTSLGVLWRIAAGNDMFVWHLGLPALLWTAERVLQERTLTNLLWFGVALGVLLLGPTFGSFTFLFLPVCLLYAAFLILERRSKLGTPRQLAQAALSILGGCVLAALIASPKLACWWRFSMKRPAADYGPIPFEAAVRYLFDFSVWKWHGVPAAGHLNRMRRHAWGVEEAAVALQPMGTFFALAGAVGLLWIRKQRGLGLFALALIGLGLTLSCSWSVFSSFRVHSHDGFRVVQRFLSVSAFGLSVLAALGADALLTRLQFMKASFTLLAAFSMFGSALWWTHMAGQFAGASQCDAVHPNAIRPFRRFAEERALADSLTSYATVRKLPGLGRDFLKGGGYSDGFLIVGNRFERHLWRANKGALPIVERTTGSGAITVSHTSINIGELMPKAQVSLRVRLPAFGLEIITIPATAKVAVREQGGFLTVENGGEQRIESVTLRARLPISSYWFALSGLSLLGTLLVLTVLTLERRRGLWRLVPVTR